MAKTFVFQVVLGATFLLASAAASAGQATSASDTEKGRWVNFTDAFTNASGKGNFRLALAFRHEDNGVHRSGDLGKTWSQLELKRGELSGAGVFSANEWVISGWTGIQRSDDSGKTWAKVAPLPCTGTVQVYNGIGYWPCNRWTKDKKWSAVMVATKDKGKTWCECRACPRTGTHSLCGHIACVSCAP